MKYLMVILLLLPVSADAAILKADAVICLSQSRIDEVVEAVDRGEPLSSVPGCFGTRYAVEYRRLSCSLQTCRVRIWPTDGESAVVFVPRRQLR